MLPLDLSHETRAKLLEVNSKSALSWVFVVGVERNRERFERDFAQEKWSATSKPTLPNWIQISVTEFQSIQNANQIPTVGSVLLDMVQDDT